MEEKVEFEKTLTISDIVSIIRHRFLWIVLIIFACVAVGYAYISLFQKTKYTATSSICVQANDYLIVDSEGKEVTANVAEHTKYQYSALLAPEYEKVLKSNEIANALKSQGVEINISSLSFKFTDSSAFFDVSYTYSVHGGNATVIKQQVANTLNEYVKKSIEIINDENSVYPTYLKDKLINYSYASYEKVSVNTGATKTLLLAFLIGVVLSAILVIVLYFTDNTIKDREDAENLLGISNLAVIDLYTNQTIGDKKSEVGGAK
ncbi:MAG: hypothetical protein J6Q58_04915 [Clostridia bacterium]|nr:hypothetical protein [Clostridia bacterium]